MAKVRIVIEMDSTGCVVVTGDVNNKIACYAMLEMARDAIYELHAAADKSIIKVSAAG